MLSTQNLAFELATPYIQEAAYCIAASFVDWLAKKKGKSANELTISVGWGLADYARHLIKVKFELKERGGLKCN